MPIYYNAETRSSAAKTTLSDIQIVEPSSSYFLLFTRCALTSREEVCCQDVTGPVSWFEDGKLYRAHSISSKSYKPLEVEPSFVVGINWSDAFFLTKKRAKSWADSCGCRHDDVLYDKELDVYSVHFHHIDNPDCLLSTGQGTHSI